jgi:phosphate transport system protein
MSKAFDKELAKLRGTLDGMAETALAMVADTVAALVTREPARMGGILDREAEVNRVEMEIDDLAWKMIALRQPMGSDLRLIITAIKVNGILERIADGR